MELTRMNLKMFLEQKMEMVKEDRKAFIELINRGATNFATQLTAADARLETLHQVYIQFGLQNEK